MDIRVLSLIKEETAQLQAPPWLMVSKQVLKLATHVNVSVDLDARDKARHPLDYQEASWLLTCLVFTCCKCLMDMLWRMFFLDLFYGY